MFGPLGLAKGDFVAICAPNCVDWIIADMACLLYGLIPVPIIPAIRTEHAAQIISKSKVTVAICTPSHLPIFKALNELKYIILMDDPFLNQDLPTSVGPKPTVRVLSEIEKLGGELMEPAIVSTREKKEMIFVQYTSGSTGTSPKGAIITESMWRAAIQARFHDSGDPFLELLKGMSLSLFF